MKRNLIYYVYPLRGAIWEWNVSQIRKYLPHFSNGKKIFIVAQDEKTETVSHVQYALNCPEAEIRAVPNDGNLWETRWFVETLADVASVEEDECTFYAHAKGVTKGGVHLSPIMAWTHALYFLNLGCIDLIDHLLEKHAAVGAFRLPMGRHPFPDAATQWYYSGTFFWMRHKALFSKDWRRIAEFPYGVELYPGRHFAFEQSYDLTDGRPHNPYVDKIARADCERWLEELISKENPI